MRIVLFRRALALAFLMFLGALNAPWLLAQARAQASDPAAPVSYVASIKRNAAGGERILMQPGRISVTGMPVRILIRQAYGPLQEFQLIGGPDWIDSDRFDIEAKLESPPAGPAGLPAMLRQMLIDRFNLKVHNEARELPIYALVLARTDGRLGPALKPSAPDCVAMMEAGRRGRGGPGPDGRGGPGLDGRSGPPPDGRGGPPPLDGRGRGPGGPGPLAFDGPPPCGSRGGGFGQFRAGGTTMAAFATLVSQAAQRVVVDKTGLTGFYDIQFSYTPAADQLPPGPPPPGVELPAIDPNGPSLFTALQEQLGLKLDSQRGPVDVVVIDSIEPPTEN